MIKRSKRGMSLLALALAMILAGSLAWFTDRDEAAIEGDSGTVIVTDFEDIEYVHMAPGDREDIVVNAKYVGSLPAKVRIRFTNPSGYLNEDLGFAIIDPDGAVVDLDDPVDLGVKETGDPIDLEGYKVHFINDSGNEYQKKQFALNVNIEALQERNSGLEWELVDNATIEILPEIH